MLDAVKLRANRLRIDTKCVCQHLADACELRQHFCALASEAWHAQSVEELRAEPRPGVARNGHVVYFSKRQSGSFKAVANSRCGKSCCVFHTIEALFLDSGDQLTIAHDGCRRVAVIRVDAQNVHRPIVSR